MKILFAILIIPLTGCTAVANYYDSQDPCQRKPYPSYCGSAVEPYPVIIQEGNWILY